LHFFIVFVSVVITRCISSELLVLIKDGARLLLPRASADWRCGKLSCFWLSLAILALSLWTAQCTASSLMSNGKLCFSFTFFDLTSPHFQWYSWWTLGSQWYSHLLCASRWQYPFLQVLRVYFCCSIIARPLIWFGSAGAVNQILRHKDFDVKSYPSEKRSCRYVPLGQMNHLQKSRFYSFHAVVLCALPGLITRSLNWKHRDLWCRVWVSRRGPRWCACLVHCLPLHSVSNHFAHVQC